MMLQSNETEDENYNQLVKIFPQKYFILACNMSLEIQFFHSRLNSPTPSNGAVSNEHRDRFCKGISVRPHLVIELVRKDISVIEAYGLLLICIKVCSRTLSKEESQKSTMS